MEIEEFKKRKNMLERELRTLISEKTIKFNQDTGCHVSNVSIYFPPANEMGNPHTTYHLNEVEVSVEI